MATEPIPATPEPEPKSWLARAAWRAKNPQQSPTTALDPSQIDPRLQPYLDAVGGAYAAESNQNAMADKYLNPWARQSKPLASLTVAGLTGMAANPYSLPEGVRERSLKEVDRAYQLAANRARSARFASGQGMGGALGGVASRNEGNLELSRAEGMADAMAAYNEMEAEIGDSRYRDILVPYLSQLSAQYDTAATSASKETKKKKRNWLKTVAGVVIAAYGAYTGNVAAVSGGVKMTQRGSYSPYYK